MSLERIVSVRRRMVRGVQRRGFTLIELLVVIFIIGVLIAATLTIVPKVKRAVYGAQTQAELSALSNAIQQYYNDYKSYPGPLANSQICAGYDTTPIPPQSASATPITLQMSYYSPYSNTSYNPTNVPNFISGTQNLTLGLLGGLEMVQTATGYAFVYNPQDIFSDGVTPAPRGPASLNVSSPRRQQAYIQVKTGDLSTPNTAYNAGAGASFADEGSRSPGDAMIPVFLDKYSNPLPILYYRTNVSGTAIAGFRNLSSKGGTALTDPNITGGPNEIAQYDLFQNLAYVGSSIGLIANNANSVHGLQGLGATALTDPIDTNVSGTNVPANGGGNALAYFKDPSLNTPGTSTNTHLGVARQKDGYLLISAGPDRQYGTHDDNIFPGPLVP